MPQYRWLEQEPAPRMLKEMLKLYGVTEAPGSRDNPTILGWAQEIGLGHVYKHDATAWCGLTVAVAAARATWDCKPCGNALWALNWAHWGTPQDVAMLGDVLVFKRDGGGHVGLYVGEDATHYHLLAGNQSDMVCIVRKAKQPIEAIRRAPWRIAQPPNVRVVHLSPDGLVSTKES
jgi:uncharacterized protein (TIGR02594 family)